MKTSFFSLLLTASLVITCLPMTSVSGQQYHHAVNTPANLHDSIHGPKTSQFMNDMTSLSSRLDNSKNQGQVYDNDLSTSSENNDQKNRRDRRTVQQQSQQQPKIHENQVENHEDSKIASTRINIVEKNREQFGRGIEGYAITDFDKTALPSKKESLAKVCEQPVIPHSGIIVKPSKSKYAAGTLVVFQCHNEASTTARCQEDGSWSRGLQYCPPTNGSCPDLGDIPFGWMNISLSKAAQREAKGSISKYPLNTKVKIFCFSGYKLEGATTLVCDPGFKWSFKKSECRPNLTEGNSSKISSKLTALLTSISFLLILVILVAVTLFYRWRQRQLQRQRWQRYFTNYTYRQSKHKITHVRPVDQQSDTHNEMKEFRKTAAVIPITDL